MKNCECGCGMPVTNDRNRYIVGHSGRGKKRTLDTRLAMSRANLRDDAGYNAIHMWRLKWKVKAGSCQHCGLAGKTEWANISGETPRFDENDWLELCRSCHRKMDIDLGRAKVPSPMNHERGKKRVKTHCSAGHELHGDHLINGRRRRCRICMAQWRRDYRARKAVADNA